MKALNLILAAFLLLFPLKSMSQNPPNYDESKVPALILADPFVSEKGHLIQ